MATEGEIFGNYLKNICSPHQQLGPVGPDGGQLLLAALWGRGDHRLQGAGENDIRNNRKSLLRDCEIFAMLYPPPLSGSHLVPPHGCEHGHCCPGVTAAGRHHRPAWPQLARGLGLWKTALQLKILYFILLYCDTLSRMLRTMRSFMENPGFRNSHLASTFTP